MVISSRGAAPGLGQAIRGTGKKTSTEVECHSRSGALEITALWVLPKYKGCVALLLHGLRQPQAVATPSSLASDSEPLRPSCKPLASTYAQRRQCSGLWESSFTSWPPQEQQRRG